MQVIPTNAFAFSIRIDEYAVAPINKLQELDNAMIAQSSKCEMIKEYLSNCQSIDLVTFVLRMLMKPHALKIRHRTFCSAPFETATSIGQLSQFSYERIGESSTPL
ncbi:hypothetical protein VNO77_33927 [Canavalia gladiata]|uniref:Uncharacterized protein n=1 Tax=Canavalia gladiata TaxID=3824 RepID=A0AAN9PY48_CANGL